MSTTIGAITSDLPPPGATQGTPALQPASPADATTEGTVPKAQPETAVVTGTSAGPAAAAITPMPIQPLSNRVLATFLQKDIELYGSTVGA